MRLIGISCCRECGSGFQLLVHLWIRGVRVPDSGSGCFSKIFESSLLSSMMGSREIMEGAYRLGEEEVADTLFLADIDLHTFLQLVHHISLHLHPLRMGYP